MYNKYSELYAFGEGCKGSGNMCRIGRRIRHTAEIKETMKEGYREERNRY
jgi:hypothetical protein